MNSAFLRYLFAAACIVTPVHGDGLEDRLKHIEKERESLPTVVAAEQTPQRVGYHGFESDPAWLVIDFGKSVTPDRIALFPARQPAVGKASANGFPASFEIEIDETPDFSASIKIAEWKETKPGEGERMPFLILEGNRASGRYLRINVDGFREDGSRRKFFRLGEIVVMAGGSNVALGRTVTHSAALVSARAWEGMNLVDGYFWCQPLQGPGSSPTDGYQAPPRKEAEVNGSVWVEIDMGVRRPVDEIRLVPANPKDVTALPGYGFPTHFRVIADPGTDEEKLVLKEDSPPFPGEALPNPGGAPVMIETPNLNARRIRVECDALWRRGSSAGGSSDFVFALAEIECRHQGMNFAAGATVSLSDAMETNEWNAAALTDGFSSTHPMLSWDAWLDGIERSEALRKEADDIRGFVFERERRESAAMRKWAVLIAGATIVIAIAAVTFQRMRSRRQQDELRERIARDLHDEIGASLSHLAMQGDLARRQLDRSELTADRLSDLSSSARETLDQMRDIVWLLSPKAGGDWSELSLRLEAIARRLLEGGGHEVRVEGHPPSGKPAIERARELVAFFKEALTNAIRHGGADVVRVTLGWGDSLHMTIEDDGRGFDPKETPASSGTGLRHLRERSSSLNAKLLIESSPGEGTRILLDVPYRSR